MINGDELADGQRIRFDDVADLYRMVAGVIPPAAGIGRARGNWSVVRECLWHGQRWALQAEWYDVGRRCVATRAVATTAGE